MVFAIARNHKSDEGENAPLFTCGMLHATPGAIDALVECFGEAKAGPEGAALLRRHMRGDWAEMSEHDQAANRAALTKGEECRVFSRYTLPDGVRIWIITEYDRSYTTILLPEEY